MYIYLFMNESQALMSWRKKRKKRSKQIYRPTSFRSPWMFYATRAVLLSFRVKNLTRENKDRRETKIHSSSSTTHTLESVSEEASVQFREMRRMNILIIITVVTFFFVISSVRSHEENDVVSVPFAAIRSSSPLLPQPLMIPLTLIHGADSKGAGFSLTIMLV